MVPSLATEADPVHVLPGFALHHSTALRRGQKLITFKPESLLPLGLVLSFLFKTQG